MYSSDSNNEELQTLSRRAIYLCREMLQETEGMDFIRLAIVNDDGMIAVEARKSSALPTKI